MPFFVPRNIPEESRRIEVTEEQAEQVFRKQNQWMEVFIEKKEESVKQEAKRPGRPRKEK